jgi:hypothetical protein
MFSETLLKAEPWPITLSVYCFALGFFDALTIVAVYFVVKADLKISFLQADLVDQVTRSSATAGADKSIETVRDAFVDPARRK